MPDFELTYAGVPFRVPPKDVLAQAQAWCRVEDAREWEYPAPSPGTARLGAARPACPSWLGLYELYQPAGASAWGVFRGLAHRDDADAMAAAALPSGGPTYGALKLKNGQADTVESRMWLLPPKPLLGVDGASDLYLITLVDERFHWQFRPFQSAGTSFDSTYPTWAALVEAIRSHLGLVLTIPTALEAAYGRPEPDSDLWAQYESPAHLLDAALANVGRVLCRTAPATGGYHALRWAECNTRLSTATTTHAAEIRGGGTSWAIGAATTDHRRAAVLPASVVVTFPRWVTGAGYDRGPGAPEHDYRDHSRSSGYTAVYAKTLAASALGSPYSSLSTLSGKALALHTTAKAEADASGGTPANQATLDTLATYLAKDFYDSQLGSLDAAYRGLLSWDQGAGVDVVYSYLTPATRVWRRPWNRYPQEFQHGFGWRKRPPETAMILVTSEATVADRYPAVRMDQHGLGATWTSAESCWGFNRRGAMYAGQTYLARRNLDQFVGLDQWDAADCCPDPDPDDDGCGCEIPAYACLLLESDAECLDGTQVLLTGGVSDWFVACDTLHQFALLCVGGVEWGVITQARGAGYSLRVSAVTVDCGPPFEATGTGTLVAQTIPPGPLDGTAFTFTLTEAAAPEDCAASGSGSGGGGVEVECEPGEVPFSFPGVFATTSGSPSPNPDGQEVAVNFLSGGPPHYWLGSGEAGGQAFYVDIHCGLDGAWVVRITFPGVAGGTVFSGTAGESSPGVWTFSITGIDIGTGGTFSFAASFAF
ncbi:MAG TPA: hypothetical protein VEI97_08090 [bacterium]|nr:hypothetical protein [bacterium]